jgi:hypothetical protein
MDVMFHALAKAASLLFTGADDVGACRQSYLGTIWIPYSSTRDYGWARSIRPAAMAVGGCHLFRLHIVFLPLIELPSHD